MKNATTAPSTDVTRKAAADRLVRDAIDAYRHAERSEAETVAAVGPRRSQYDPLLDVAETRTRDAAKNLVRAILGTGGDDAEKYLAPAQGVRRDGRLYMVGPEADIARELDLGRERGDGDDVMLLTVIDECRIADVVEFPGPGEAIALGDEPAEEEDHQVEEDAPLVVGQPVPHGRFKKRPMPLLRATHTLCHPSDNWPVTLELIVLSVGFPEDEHTADVVDCPELQLAGWQDQLLGPLHIYTRVVVA